MKAKKVLALGLGAGLIISMCGCRYDYTYDLSSTGAAKIMQFAYYTEDEVKQLSSDTSKYEKVTLEDGKTYYMKSEIEDKSYDELNAGLETGIMKPNLVYVPCDKIDEQTNSNSESSSVPDLYNAMKINMTYMLNEDVIETNGEVSEDKRSVYYDYKGKTAEGYLYIYTASGKNEIDTDTTAPVIGGIKKSKYINNLGLKKIRISDNLALKSVTCNGIDMKSYTYNLEGKQVRHWMLKDMSQYKQGKNKIVATDLSGNKSSFTFKYDSVPPVIKKIKNYQTYYSGKKITFYVKDKTSGISKVTYFKDYGKEKKVAKKYIKKVKKGKYKGYYKVTLKFNSPCYLKFYVYDKAGNTSEIYGCNVI
ncbi:MAG: hypothetical protein J5517_10545 [Eubacterium sp.]|nr:hypothetical protein [Eubacterium sp.]